MVYYIFRKRLRKVNAMKSTGNAICDSFICECDAYSEKSGALSYACETILSKKRSSVEGAVAEYSYSAFVARLIYNVSVGGAKSVIEMRISFPGCPEVDFSLYDLLYMLDENDFKCYIFPYIESKERMSACVRALFSALDTYRVQLCAIGEDKKLTCRAASRKKKEMRRYFRADIFTDGQDIFDPLFIWQKGCYRDWYIARFCARWYRDYILGNYSASAKAFSKYESKSDYEIRLLRYIKALGSGADNVAVSEECNTFILWKNAFSSMRRPAYFKAFAILFLPLVIGYSAFSFAAYYVMYSSALFCTSFLSGAMIAAPAICAFITDLFLSDMVYGVFMSESKKKRYRQTAAYMKTEEEDRAGMMFLNLTVALSLIAVSISVKWGIAVYPSGICDNKSLFSSESKSFSDVVSARDTGKKYNISFNDGTVYSCSYDVAKKYILPRLSVNLEK